MRCIIIYLFLKGCLTKKAEIFLKSKLLRQNNKQ